MMTTSKDMKLVLAEPKYLKDSISIISELVTEAKLEIKKDRLELIAMDPANVAMVIFKLLSSAFVEYNIDKETEIAINLENFKKILRRSKPSDTLTLELDEKANRLKIQLKGESRRTFSLALIDYERSGQKIPELEFKAKIKLPTTVFDEAIEDMDVIAESVAFVANPEMFLIKSESKTNEALTEITKDDETKIDLTEDKEREAKYSLEYLKKIAKACKIADYVEINFDDEYPLKADYKILDKLELGFILAPRVSND